MPDVEPGSYVVTFERIGAHRPGPLTATVTSAEDLEEQIRRYADTYTLSADILVCVEAPAPGRSIGTGWISSGGRDAGRFTWRPHAAVATAVESEES
jgi:hypothetical protein